MSEERHVLTNDFQSIHSLLSLLVERIVREEGQAVIDVDRQMDELTRTLPAIPYSREELREEFARLATERGLAVKMG
jgi:hypothetical protein